MHILTVLQSSVRFFKRSPFGTSRSFLHQEARCLYLKRYTTGSFSQERTRKSVHLSIRDFWIKYFKRNSTFLSVMQILLMFPYLFTTITRPTFARCLFIKLFHVIYDHLHFDELPHTISYPFTVLSVGPVEHIFFL